MVGFYPDLSRGTMSNLRNISNLRRFIDRQGGIERGAKWAPRVVTTVANVAGAYAALISARNFSTS